jgi:microcystin-dependent protein
MLRSVYDPSNHGFVDKAAALSTAGVVHQFWKNGNVWGAPDWTDLTSIPATFAPSAHEASHVTGSDQIPLAGPATKGLLNATSGNTTDFIDGTNASRNLVTAIPLASNTGAGLLARTSGNTTDFIDGTNASQNLATAIRPIGAAPPGAIMDFAGSAAPTGWLLCDGSAVNRTTYSALFAVIGTAFGAGDGTTTFNLPDARGRATIGAGQGSGLTNRALAANGGEENHLLAVAELAAHAHALSSDSHTHGLSADSHTHTFNQASHRHQVGGTGSAGTGAYSVMVPGSGWFTDYQATGDSISAAASGVVIAAAASGVVIANAGGNTAHNTMQPFIVFNKIIKN